MKAENHKKKEKGTKERGAKKRGDFFFFFSLKTFIKSRTFVEEKEHKLLFEKVKVELLFE